MIALGSMLFAAHPAPAAPDARAAPEALTAPAVPAARGVTARCSMAPFHEVSRPETIILGVAHEDTVRAGAGAVQPTAHPGHSGRGTAREVYGQRIHVLEGTGIAAGVLGVDSVIVIVPWDYDPACRPTYWSKSAAWSPAGEEGYYSVQFRPREEWVDHPVADVFMAALQPYPHGAFFKAGYRGTSALRTELSLTARQYYHLMAAMPTREEVEADRGATLARLQEWEFANQSLSTLYPARLIIARARSSRAR